MATFERGFKAWAERTALSFRKELGLEVRDLFQPKTLVEYLGITLWTPIDVPGIPEAVTHQLLEEDPWGWSAVSVEVNDQAIIIFNPRKSKGGQASDIMHETAHIILDHRPATLMLSQDLCLAMRSFDAKQEDEANWLAWCLLLPHEALLWAKRTGLSNSEIAEHFGVTETLVNFRIQKTGVSAQFQASARRTRGRSKLGASICCKGNHEPK